MARPIHFEIPANDVDAAKTFFSDVFGWTYQQMPGMDYHIVTTGSEGEPGINGAIMKKMDPNQPMTNAISVESIDETMQKVIASGGSVALPKAAVPTMGYYAYFKDLDGNIHGLWENDTNAK